MGELARSVLAQVVRQLNTVKGGRLISNSSFAKAICGEGPAIAKLRCGATAIVLLQDHVGRSMYLWGQHDPRVAHVMEAVISKGDTVLDIGANFGVLGLQAAVKVGSTGRVHLFEPLPQLAQYLRASLMLGGFSWAQVHECALSSYEGFADIAIVEPENLGMTTLIEADCESAAERVLVRVESAGEYVRALDGPPAAIVKIDVEGHEGVILNAIQGWMSDVVPAFVLFECHIGPAGFWREMSVNILAGLGYSFYAYDVKRLWRTELRPVLAHEQRPQGYDFVAIHPSAWNTPAGMRFEKMLSKEAKRTSSAVTSKAGPASGSAVGVGPRSI